MKPAAEESKGRQTSTAASTVHAEKKKEIGHSHRLMGWAALFLFSAVALAAQVSGTRDASRGNDDWFVIVVCIVTVSCSFFSLLGYGAARTRFAGSMVEGFFAVLTIIFWICGMPVIMDPDRNIAVSKGISSASNGNVGVVFVGSTVTTDVSVANEFTFIRNANIYFFSWASTIAIVYIMGRFVKERRRSADRSATGRVGPKTNFWYLLTLASLVVMVDSIELFSSFNCPGTNPDLCMRTKYSVSLGTVGTFLSSVGSVLATIGYLNRWLEVILAFLMFGFYMCGVGLITFNDGPGTSLGNLYFATWMGASVTAILLARAVQDFNAPVQVLEDVPEKPVDPNFPDVEMGEEKENEGVEVDIDDENNPSWVKVGDASVTKSSKDTKEAKPEDSVELEWNAPKKKKEKEVVVEPEKVEPGVEDDMVVMADKTSKATPVEDKNADTASDTEKDIRSAEQPKATKRASSKAELEKKSSNETKSDDDPNTNPFNDGEDTKPADKVQPKKRNSTTKTSTEKKAEEVTSSADGEETKTIAADEPEAVKESTKKQGSNNENVEKQSSEPSENQEKGNKEDAKEKLPAEKPKPKKQTSDKKTVPNKRVSAKNPDSSTSATATDKKEPTKITTDDDGDETKEDSAEGEF